MQQSLRIVALLLLFTAAAVYESTHLSALNAPEVWVHLRTGTWMMENHAIPRTGLFSQYSNLAWDDATWGFDLLLGIAYRVFGLHSIPLVMMGLRVAVAIVTFLLARSGRAGFWQSVVLSALAQYIVRPQPVPYVFSILLFAVELQLLLGSRYFGSVRRLYWLPALFVVWANLHIQFVLGLILLAAFEMALLIEYWLRSAGVRWLSERILPLPLKLVSMIAALSFLATWATPYGYRLFLSFFKDCYSDVAFQHFSEMSAMSFRQPQDYGLMLLVMMAFLFLGRRRSLELFELLILLGGTAVAFRIQRDGWIVVLAAIAVLSRASFLRARADTREDARTPPWEWGAIAGAAAILLVIAAVRLPERRWMMNRISQNFPVRACDFIMAKKLPAPLFNEYSFGSFLTWYLPEYPVVVDSRVGLYGDKILTEYFDVIGGKERLDAHPMVARAGTLLLERNSAMAKALTNLAGLKVQYRLVYSDGIADLFVPVRQ